MNRPIALAYWPSAKSSVHITDEHWQFSKSTEYVLKSTVFITDEHLSRASSLAEDDALLYSDTYMKQGIDSGLSHRPEAETMLDRKLDF